MYIYICVNIYIYIYICTFGRSVGRSDWVAMHSGKQLDKVPTYLAKPQHIKQSPTESY